MTRKKSLEETNLINKKEMDVDRLILVALWVTFACLSLHPNFDAFGAQERRLVEGASHGTVQSKAQNLP